jgi:PqqD family protein of HPr-rel-A system
MAGPFYIADAAEELEAVTLDGLSVLFHARSGMTHIVASPAPEMLEALREGPADARELLRRLSTQFDLDGEEAKAAIHARLDELEAAGLVRRA